VRQRLFKK